MLTTILAEGGNGKWLPHSINEVIWGTLAFSIIMGLLAWKAGPAIRKAMNGRTERIQSELDEATQLRETAEAELDRTRSALANADEESARIVAEAHETAERIRSDILGRIDGEIEAMRTRHAAELAASQRQAQADLAGEVQQIASKAAERIVESSLDDATQQDLIERYIAQVGANN